MNVRRHAMGVRQDAPNWPDLQEPYRTALHDCVRWVLERFEVSGIIAAGTIIAGHPDPASDLDVYVVHAIEKRKRVQRFFNGVPCEIFINPPSAIRKYFEQEFMVRRPSTAHMLSTGTVVVRRDDVVEALVNEAKAFLAREPEISSETLNALRYVSACHLEDAVDLQTRDSAASAWKYTKALEVMLEYFFCQKGEFYPREKALFARAMELDEELGILATKAITSSALDERQHYTLAVADRTIGARGFFEWDSELEDTE
jgi:hypothetical protein